MARMVRLGDTGSRKSEDSRLYGWPVNVMYNVCGEGGAAE